jgi:RNA polymerase sigma-70 factor (ECF subfamily)
MSDRMMRTQTDISPNHDHADLVRVRNGDTAAFAEIVRRHSRQAYAIARAILDNHADADDAVQEAWLRVWRSLGTFDMSASFQPWLWRIVANTSRDLRRRRSIRYTDSLCDDMPSAKGEHSETIALREGLQLAIAKLSPRRKEIVLLHDVYGIGHQEIADTLGLRVGTVRAELCYARRELRDSLVDWRHPGGSVTFFHEGVSHA